VPAASTAPPDARRRRWYYSFYWRIALGFTALVVMCWSGSA
jgi:hypothetical protein